MNKTVSQRRQAIKTVAKTSIAATLMHAIGMAKAQSTKVVKLILPNATGSGVDAIARGIAPTLGKHLNGNVVVENQAGASGIVGLQALSKTAPDGLNLSIVSNNVVIFPSVKKSLPFDMPGDFTPISIVGTTPMVLVINPKKVPANNGKEFIAYLKANPDKLNFGSGGEGTILHLAAEMFIDEANVKARHVPYKGVGPMVTDLIGGQIEFGVLAAPSVLQHIKSGALKAIGQCSDKRSATMSDVPTFVEQGLPNYVMEAWFGVIGPKGMSADLVKQTHAALVATFDDPAVKELMARQGNTISVSSSDAAQRGFRSEMAKYAALVKKAGIQPD